MPKKGRGGPTYPGGGQQKTALGPRHLTLTPSDQAQGAQEAGGWGLAGGEQGSSCEHHVRFRSGRDSADP